MFFTAYGLDIQNSLGKLLAEAEETIQECMCKWQLTKFKVHNII